MHVAIFQKAGIFIFAAVRTQNLKFLSDSKPFPSYDVSIFVSFITVFVDFYKKRKQLVITKNVNFFPRLKWKKLILPFVNKI
jgi:hypothetical protein